MRANHLNPDPAPGDYLAPELDTAEWMAVGDLVIVDDMRGCTDVAGEIIAINARLMYAKVSCTDGVVRNVAAEEMKLVFKGAVLTCAAEAVR